MVPAEAIVTVNVKVPGIFNYSTDKETVEMVGPESENPQRTF